MTVISEEQLEEIRLMIFDGKLKEVLKLTGEILKKNKQF